MRFLAKSNHVGLGLSLLLCACGEPSSTPDGSESSPSAAVETTSMGSEGQASPGADTSPNSSSSEQEPQSPELLPTWQNFGNAFLRNWCKGCHSNKLQGAARFGAPEGVDLGTLEELRNWQSRVAARATGDTPSMPPAGGPSREEIRRLKQWLELGAP